MNFFLGLSKKSTQKIIFSVKGGEIADEDFEISSTC